MIASGGREKRPFLAIFPLNPAKIMTYVNYLMSNWAKECEAM